MRLEFPNFRVVVCDNGSNDDSLHEIRNWVNYRDVRYAEYGRAEAEAGGLLTDDPELTLIRNDKNLGFAGGSNVGLRYSMARGDADYCWLLNNDTVVEPDALFHLVVRMQNQKNVGICGSTILLHNDHTRIQALGGGHYFPWIGLPWHYGRLSTWGKPINLKRAELWMNYVEGASMLVSPQFLDEIGLLCEDYFLYFEEADWAQRAKGRFMLGYAPRSIVYHKVGASIGTATNPRRKSCLCDYYALRNRLLFTQKYYPLSIFSIYAGLMVELLVRLLLGRWDLAGMICRLLLFGVAASDQRLARNEVIS
jgi:GT2 family glycosyltransferase